MNAKRRRVAVVEDDAFDALRRLTAADLDAHVLLTEGAFRAAFDAVRTITISFTRSRPARDEADSLIFLAGITAKRLAFEASLSQKDLTDEPH